jgi:hypothetical protein
MVCVYSILTALVFMLTQSSNISRNSVTHFFNANRTLCSFLSSGRQVFCRNPCVNNSKLRQTASNGGPCRSVRRIRSLYYFVNLISEYLPIDSDFSTSYVKNIDDLMKEYMLKILMTFGVFSFKNIA